MNENLKNIKNEIKSDFERTNEWFKKEISALHGSRLSIELLDSIKIDCYNSKMSLKEVSTLSLVDAKTISIEPWDKSLLPSIEKCLSAAGLEGNIKNEGNKILFSMPVSSQEDREKIVKLLNKKLEQAKESLRHLRDEQWSKIQDMERKGEIPEDEKYKAKEDLQELINQHEGKLKTMTDIKEKEILQ
jgi:ribosome recycling factor